MGTTNYLSTSGSIGMLQRAEAHNSEPGELPACVVGFMRRIEAAARKGCLTHLLNSAPH